MLAWGKSQQEIANLLSASYPADIVSKWHKMQDNFDRDSSKPNLYEEADNRMFLSFVNHFVSDSTTDLTMAQLRLELLKEEAKQTSSHWGQRGSYPAGTLRVF